MRACDFGDFRLRRDGDHFLKTGATDHLIVLGGEIQQRGAALFQQRTGVEKIMMALEQGGENHGRPDPSPNGRLGTPEIICWQIPESRSGSRRKVRKMANTGVMTMERNGTSLGIGGVTKEAQSTTADTCEGRRAAS